MVQDEGMLYSMEIQMMSAEFYDESRYVDDSAERLRQSYRSTIPLARLA